MKIILPSKRGGSQDFLMGYTDLHKGAEVLRGNFEQAFRDAGYPEADVPRCSVFVCRSTGDQLAFSTTPDQATPAIDVSPPVTVPTDVTPPDASQTPQNQDTGAAL